MDWPFCVNCGLICKVYFIHNLVSWNSEHLFWSPLHILQHNVSIFCKKKKYNYLAPASWLCIYFHTLLCRSPFFPLYWPRHWVAQILDFCFSKERKFGRCSGKKSQTQAASLWHQCWREDRMEFSLSRPHFGRLPPASVSTPHWSNRQSLSTEVKYFVHVDSILDSGTCKVSLESKLIIPNPSWTGIS